MKYLGRVGIGSVLVLLFASCGGAGGATADGSAIKDGQDVDASGDAMEAGSEVLTDVGSDVETDDAACLLPVTVGCFSGAVCASPQVQAVCMNGAWHCPAGTSSTESCAAPDSGVDVSGGS